MSHNKQKKEQEVMVMYAVDSKKPYVVSDKQSEEFHRKMEQCTREFGRVFKGVKLKRIDTKEAPKK